MIDQDIFEGRVDFLGAKILLYVDEVHAIFEQRDGKENYPFQIDLIGGGRIDNELPVETLVREVYEETGLIINKSNIVFAKKYPSVIDSTKIGFFFVAKIDPSQRNLIKYTDEGLGLVFLDPKVFVTLDNGVAGQQSRVRDYLKILGS